MISHLYKFSLEYSLSGENRKTQKKTKSTCKVKVFVHEINKQLKPIEIINLRSEGGSRRKGGGLLFGTKQSKGTGDTKRLRLPKVHMY